MVTSAAIFFLVGPPSANVTSTYSGAPDSLMQQIPLAPDFWAHPETKVSSFPVPDGTIPQQVIDNRSMPDDSTVRIEEYVLPDYQRVTETVDRKF
jgi:hypothetical protein